MLFTNLKISWKGWCNNYVEYDKFVFCKFINLIREISDISGITIFTIVSSGNTIFTMVKFSEISETINFSKVKSVKLLFSPWWNSVKFKWNYWFDEIFILHRNLFLNYSKDIHTNAILGIRQLALFEGF